MLQPVCSMSKMTNSAPASAAMRPMPVVLNSKTIVPSARRPWRERPLDPVLPHRASPPPLRVPAASLADRGSSIASRFTTCSGTARRRRPGSRSQRSRPIAAHDTRPSSRARAGVTITLSSFRIGSSDRPAPARRRRARPRRCARRAAPSSAPAGRRSGRGRC